MPIKTYAEQLEEVQTAISKLMGGAQEYRIGERMFRAAELEWLHKREEYLMTKYQQEQARSLNGGGIRTRYGVPTFD
jgi:hypothetical protein